MSRIPIGVFAILFPATGWGGEFTDRCIALDSETNAPRTLEACTIALDREDPEAAMRTQVLISRGVAARNLKLFDLSVADLEEAVALRPRNANALRMLAWTYRTMDRPRRAEAVYSRVLEFDDHWQGWLSRCAVRADLEKWRPAVSDCMEALTREKNEDVFFFLAYAQNNDGDYLSALETVEDAFSAEIFSPRLFVEGAFSQISMGQRSNAARLISRGLERFPSDSELLDMERSNGL